MTPAAALDELRALDQWVVWRSELRKGKRTRVPYRPTGRAAASDDPSTWSPHADVVAASARFDGIGFVFSPEDPFTGVDIDGALRDGQLHPDVIRIIEELATYAEWSPSHEGVHLLVRAVKPAGGSSTKRTPWGDELAIYDRLRYFTITGERLPSAPETIEERQAELDALHAKYLPSRNGSRPDPDREDGDHQEDRARERRPVAELLETFARLKEISARKGTPPADPSGSGWDHYFACQGIRDGLTDREVADVMRHSHGLHGERKDDRYIERTIEAAHRSEPGQDHVPDGEGLGASIARRWKLDCAIVDGWTVGKGDAARVHLVLDDGRELVFPRLADFFNIDAHVRRVSLIAKCKCPSLKKHQAVEIGQDIVALCEAEVDPDEDIDETEGWLGYFISSLGTITPGELRQPGPKRWAALVAVEDFTPDPEAQREVAARTAAIRDSEGRLWIPSEQFMRHVRHVERASIDWGTLTTRMEALGWTRHKLGAREPGVQRADNPRRIRLSFFVEEQPNGD